ncbi:hypothetical protein [Halorientalis halophila]|uniref:hypothetical protein n=1 Tax=Halorientalis halophila TaxID=3108499 RepID=UPI00300969BA
MSDALSLLAVALQVAIAVTLVEAVRRRNLAAVANALLALGIAVLPPVVVFVVDAVFGRPLTVDATVTIWIAAAGVLHSLGMLGLYESVWWWDHLTHTVSAALVAALVYAALVVTLAASTPAIAVLTVGYTLIVGVFWELIELVARDVAERYDVEPVLVHYGWRDTALDLVFDAVGALLVVGFNLRVFVHVFGRFPSITRTLFLGGTGVILLGSLVMVVSLAPIGGE